MGSIEVKSITCSLEWAEGSNSKNAGIARAGYLFEVSICI